MKVLKLDVAVRVLCAQSKFILGSSSNVQASLRPTQFRY